MEKTTYFNGFILVLWACKHEAKDEITPTIIETPCDTIVAYKNIIRIMDLHCNNESCHSEATKAGDIALEQYEDIKKHTLSGDIYHTVTLPTDDELFMPQGSEKLSDCEIQQIKIWANNGAKK